MSRLVVRPRIGARHEARLQAVATVVPCVIGPAGFTARKREGDGATPIGTFPVIGAFFRSDRGPRLPVAVPLRVTRRQDGWCDDPTSPCYNQPVRLPHPARHETMWREDRLYDRGLVIDYNQRRPRKRLGSAIFLHVMPLDGGPTAGCVALRPADLRRLLPRLAPGCRLTLG